MLRVFHCRYNVAGARQVLNRDIAYDSGSFDQLHKAVRIPRQGAAHRLRQGNRDKRVERRKSDASRSLYFLKKIY